jgi:hypothetical protein
MTDQEFRGLLEDMGFNQSSFARRLIELGDPRSFETALRSIANYARGASGVPAEMVVVLRVMERWPAVRGKPVTRGAGRPRKG